jgi:LAS superfamily LD-carboxypeptidase LdcB
MTTYPVLPIILPKDLKHVQNGKLDSELLRKLKGYPKGKMHHTAATAFNALQLHAYFKGYDLTPTSSADCYRTYEQQLALFKKRYSTTETGRKPQVTRKFENKIWYLNKGMAPSAAPGTSNHGLGLAVDIAGATGRKLKWMIGDGYLNCPVLQYGFSWEVKDGPNAESWHIRYVAGDKLTPAVLEALEAFPDLKA